MLIEKLGQEYSDLIDVKVYQAGKDFSYLRKYGMITKGTMIVDQKKKYDRLSKKVIEKIIVDLVD